MKRLQLNKLNELHKPGKPNKLLWVSLRFISFLTVGIPSIVHAELGDLFSYFQPYISAQEEYNSNIDLTPTNRREDYITIVSPGLRFSTLPRGEVTRAQQAPTAEQNFGIDLNFNAGFVFYAKEEDNNFTT